MSVSLPTIIIIALGAVILVLGGALLLVLRKPRAVDDDGREHDQASDLEDASGHAPNKWPFKIWGSAAEAESDAAAASGDTGASAPAGEAAPTAGATEVAPADAAQAAREAAAAGVREGLATAFTAVRSDLQRWTEAAAANALDRHLAQKWDELRERIVTELRSATAAEARAARAGADGAAAHGTAAPAPDQAGSTPGPAAAEPELARDPGAEPLRAPDGIVGPEDGAPSSSGVTLTRPTSQDLLGSAAEWLGPLGIDAVEMERLRVNAAAPDPAEAVRKLFDTLHQISAERRLAPNRAALNWERVGPALLTEFIGRFHPQVETQMIWPRIGDNFDPRTMHYLHKEASGRGLLTEVVAPGYSIGSGEDAVKALVVY